MSSISRYSSDSLFTISEERASSPELPPLPAPTVAEDSALKLPVVITPDYSYTPPMQRPFDPDRLNTMAQILSSHLMIYVHEEKLDSIDDLLQKRIFLLLDRKVLSSALNLAVKIKKLDVVQHLLQYRRFLAEEDFATSIQIAADNKNGALVQLLQEAVNELRARSMQVKV